MLTVRQQFLYVAADKVQVDITTDDTVYFTVCVTALTKNIINFAKSPFYLTFPRLESLFVPKHSAKYAMYLMPWYTLFMGPQGLLDHSIWKIEMSTFEIVINFRNV